MLILSRPSPLYIHCFKCIPKFERKSLSDFYVIVLICKADNTDSIKKSYFNLRRVTISSIFVSVVNKPYL